MRQRRRGKRRLKFFEWRATWKYNLYIPDGTAYTEIEIKKGMAEEDIEKVASVYIDGLKETKMLDNNVRVLNVFKSGDWLYLDMTGAFSSSLKTLGKDKAAARSPGLSDNERKFSAC